MSFLLQENGGALLQENGFHLLLDNTVVEFKIVNNLIVDSNRELYINNIYNALAGISYYPFKAETVGLGYFEIGDRIITQDPAGNNYEVLVFDITINLTGGMDETLQAVTPPQTSTNYNYAGVVGRKITNTEIKVDKQNGEIALINTNLQTNYLTSDQTSAQINLKTDAIVSSVSAVSTQVNTIANQEQNNANNISNITSSITTIQQTQNDINFRVSHSGGVNLLKNAVGLKGSITEWQLFDTSGNLLDVRNNGTIDQSTNTQTNTESGSAINLQNQYIQQTVPTITGQSYTVYLRYKNTLACNLTLTGVTGLIALPISASWSVFKYVFIATGTSTTFRLENSTGGATATISDIVLKLGDASGWVQAPNEVYGSNFTFDKNGFSVTSLSSPFKAVLDNQKLTIYDTSGGTNRIVMQVSKDFGLITDLTVQDQFILQRYNNPASELRLIPTATGAMLVINN